MSDTPRTDAATREYYDEMNDETEFYLVPSFGRKLERECDQLAKQCVKNVEEIGQLRAELKQSASKRLHAEDCLKSWKEDEGADAARLDWLVEYGNKSIVDLADQNIFITREAIDEAMQREAQS